MKTRVTTFLLLLIFSISAEAQWIQGITCTPANPTTSDIISVVADVSFPSGDCNEKTMYQSQTGNTFFTSALHCVGMLSFICSTADTFYLGQLPAGTYTLKFQLDMGQGPSPCTPGIVPGPQDSITFTVTTATGLPQVSDDKFSIFPNPGRDGFTVKVNGLSKPHLEVLDLQGRVVASMEIASDQKVDLHHLSDGNYIVELKDGTTFITRKSWVKRGR